MVLYRLGQGVYTVRRSRCWDRVVVAFKHEILLCMILYLLSLFLYVCGISADGMYVSKGLPVCHFAVLIQVHVFVADFC